MLKKIAVMEAIASARRRKQQLEMELLDLKTAIDDLKSNPFNEVNKESREKRLNIKVLMKAVEYTEKINKINYEDVNLVKLGEQMEYQADATTGPVKYHLQFKVISSEETQSTISDLKINCYDEFIQAELKPWLNKCMRENSSQTFQRGVVTYGELFTKREEVLVYLKKNASECFLVEKCIEEGKYIISAVNRDTDTQYFWCAWALAWDSATNSMKNFFNLQASKRVLSGRNDALFAELTKSTSERVEEIWKTLAKNVIEAIHGSSQSSS